MASRAFSLVEGVNLWSRNLGRFSSIGTRPTQQSMELIFCTWPPQGHQRGGNEWVNRLMQGLLASWTSGLLSNY